MIRTATGRRLATILAADAVGYSRAMSRDEALALRALSASRSIFYEEIERRGGRVFSTAGDSVLAEFPSASRAVETAIAIQRRMQDAAGTTAVLTYRIGIHHGAVHPHGGDLLGDAVNIAARIESLAFPGGICLSGQVLEAASGTFDAQLVEMGPQVLKNILGPVRVLRCRVGEPEPANGDAAPARSTLVGVLPFRAASSDTEAYLAEGLADDLVVGLCRFRQLAVTGPGAASTHDPLRLAAEIGAAYVVQGSVRRLPGALRIDVRLVDGRSGRILWAQRFASSADDVPSFQDDVVERIVGTVAGRIEDSSIEAARRVRPDNAEAFDRFLQGLHYANRSDKVSNAIALEHLEAAVAQDGGYALAWAWLALMRLRQSSWQSGAADLAPIRRAAEHALSLDPGESWCHLVAGQIAMYARELDVAEVHHKKACSLNPYSTHIMALRSPLATYLGKPEEGIDWAERAMARYEAYPSWYASNLGLAHYCARNYRQAAEVFGGVIEPSVGVLAGLAAARAQLGDQHAVEAATRRINEREPAFSSRHFMTMRPFKRDEDREHLVDGLRRAGLA